MYGGSQMGPGGLNNMSTQQKQDPFVHLWKL